MSPPPYRPSQPPTGQPATRKTKTTKPSPRPRPTKPSPQTGTKPPPRSLVTPSSSSTIVKTKPLRKPTGIATTPTPIPQPAKSTYTSWVSNTISTAGATATRAVSNAAGAAVNAGARTVSNGLSAAGQVASTSVVGLTRGWADGVRNYGNVIKDRSDARGPRYGTKSNPLGLSGSSARNRGIGGGGGGGMATSYNNKNARPGVNHLQLS